MKLTVKERLTLGNTLPGEGDFVTLKVLRKLKGDLSFSEEEFKKWEIKSVPGGDGRSVSLTWRTLDSENKPIDQEAEIEIGEKANDMVVLALSKLNEGKKLRQEHFTLYEKFVNGAK